MKPLRPYQVDAVAKTWASIRAGKRGVVLVSPTGSGKTRIGSEMARRCVVNGKRVLWLAHRRELVTQAANTIRADGGIQDVGVISASKAHLYNPQAPVQVATLQTLMARGEAPPADFVVFDEAHHYKTNEWGAFCNHYAKAVRVGPTATPQSGDGKPLSPLLFDDLIEVISVKELVSMGFLVPHEIIAPPNNLGSNLARDPAEAWEDAGCKGRPTIVFARDVSHGIQLEHSFRMRGANARFVEQNTAQVIRERSIDDFMAGRVDVLINVFILTEGTDMPLAEVCILARPCKAACTYIQSGGRVLRPSKATGKTKATLIDLCGAFWLHGFLDDEREYSLTGKGIKSKEVGDVRQCLACGGTWRPEQGPTCTHCGESNSELIPGRKRKSPKLTGDELTLVDRDAQRRAKEEEKERARIERERRKHSFLRRTMSHEERIAFLQTHQGSLL